MATAGTRWTHSSNTLPLHTPPNVETPVLLMHGEADHRCPIEQSEQYFVTLKRLGKEVEFVPVPGQLPRFRQDWSPQTQGGISFATARLDEQAHPGYRVACYYQCLDFSSTDAILRSYSTVNQTSSRAWNLWGHQSCTKVYPDSDSRRRTKVAPLPALE